MLEETVGILAATQPLPPWHTSGPDAPWKPAGAWRAVDVWESERVLFIEYDGPHPHTLMAQICQTGGILVTKLAVLQVGAAEAWDTMREDEDVPMPITEQPVAEVLGDLAASLRMTDMTWPRHDDDDFTDHRALAWARCRDHLPDWPDEEGLPGSERERLIEAFTVTSGRDDVSRSLAELFLDYGEGYIRAGPLCWSSGEVMLFLTDWLPRKAMLDAAQRQALPGVLRQWLAFALTERGLDPKWITQVTDAVDTFVPEFRDAFGDQTAWGPAKQIVAELMDRGIDLTDREAIDSAIHALNAERLARQLTD